MDYLDPGRGKTGQGYFWICASAQGDVVFHWETSRAAACLANLVPVDFTGTVQCDGYAAYPSFAKQHPQPIVLAGCWAHVRRKFYDAREQSPKLTGWFLRQIQLLYQVEAALRERKSGPELRAAVRASTSRWIVQRLHHALVRHKTRHLSKSLLGQAIDYALAQWPTLEVYLGDGRVEIDNNRVENAIRPTAVGKKNSYDLWQGETAGTESGGGFGGSGSWGERMEGKAVRRSRLVASVRQTLIRESFVPSWAASAGYLHLAVERDDVFQILPEDYPHRTRGRTTAFPKASTRRRRAGSQPRCS